MSNSPDDVNLLLPDTGVFTCQQSGACCETDWLIGVEAAAYQRLKAVDWSRHDPALGAGEKFQPLPRPLQSGETHTFARTPAGACVFLTGDRRCAIQLHRGRRDKPQVCREFPYVFVRTPAGIAVGLSFACTAVRGHRGRPLAEQIPEIREVLAGSQRVRELPEPLELVPGVELGWETYTAVEAGLVAVLQDRSAPFAVGLVAGSILIDLCVELTRPSRRRGGGPAVGDPPPGAALGRALDELERAGYRPLLEIARRVRPPRRVSLTYLAPLYTWLEVSRQPMSRWRLGLRLYANLLRFDWKRGRLEDVVTGQRPVAIGDVGRVVFAEDEPGVEDLLREYWTHVLVRKTLAPMHGAARGYRTMLALYGFLKWAARLRALQDGRARTTKGDVEAAVRLVEQRFVLHSGFADLFDVNPLLTVLADRTFGRARFVRAAVLERPA